MSQTLPHPDAPLVLAPTLDLRVEQGRGVSVLVNGRRHGLPPDALAWIAAMRGPRSFRNLVAGLGVQTTGAVAWIEATRMLGRLVEIGLLVPADADDTSGARAAAAARPSGREIEMHIELLDDVARTQAFIAAIRANVKPGDVVVDLGTGNGVLAMAAAAAGARRVYAIEASDFADVAEAIFAANGHADTIRLVRGWSQQVELPERADVLVSEIIGNDPLGEGALRYMPDAAKRFLKPGGRLLPSRLAVSLQPVGLPDDEAAALRVGGERLDRWRAAYGFDFAPLHQHASTVMQRIWRQPAQTASWPRLGEAERLFAADLATFPVETTVELVLRVARSRHPALLMTARMAFPNGASHFESECGGHWRQPVIVLPAAAGETWRVKASWGPLRGGVDVEATASG